MIKINVNEMFHTKVNIDGASTNIDKSFRERRRRNFATLSLIHC